MKLMACARALALLLLVFGTLAFDETNPRAEYGDVVINNYSDAAGMRPVVFPHWFHRVRFRCKVCHADLGFQFKAGGNQINMVKIIDGQFCGACHNGDLAWSVENCNLCHSGEARARRRRCTRARVRSSPRRRPPPRRRRRAPATKR